MEKFNALKELLLASEKDAVSFFERGNKSAGTRLRKNLQQAKSLAQELRLEVTAKKNEK